MFDLPKSTEIRKTIHKKLIYQQFPNEFIGDKKIRFDNDISKIIITNELSENSVNIKATDDISSIFVLQIELKTKNYNDKNIVIISKIFGQKLILILHFEDEYQLAIYETKLLKSEWKKEGDIRLHIDGLDFSTVWNNLVTFVSGISVKKGNTLSKQIEIDSEKERLKKKIFKLKNKARKEVQSKRKFEIFQQIQEYTKKLKDM